MTIVGCGVQGGATVEAIRLVRRIRKIHLVDKLEGVTMRLAESLEKVEDLEVVTGISMDEAVAESDIVVTSTTSRSAILDARHLHAGLFIAAVGADNPEKQELAPDLLRESRIVVDILKQAFAMGDLHHALKAGLVQIEDVHGELADVICGRIAGRRSGEEVFVFDSTGTALQDVAVASIALARSRERGSGIEVQFG